ncbi:hypothetical protein [Effusibacillus dendaii]|uniref:Uncharacterized protein n=1 Tax=Effusibacillus dendaii TaxID=2743772 RepID=A0A7I8D6Z3_9BACL|nr:hypothetical protein [Effusibacillus dendaii]BCJ85767.1 hypothetical protein skT53_07520 [Effusibacillus dendaii]
MNYALILENSRKAKSARQVYEYLRNNNKHDLLPPLHIEPYNIRDGVKVAQQDKHRVLNLRLHDEHLSPYFKTDMNLFILLMLNDQVDMQVYREDHGWMFVFENLQSLPKPFGSQGFDMR